MTEPTTGQLATAAAQAFLPLAGPYGVLASTALTAGLQFWTEFSGKMSRDEITMEDLENAAIATGASLTALKGRVDALPK